LLSNHLLIPVCESESKQCSMGGARNLKLGATGAKDRAQGANKFFVWTKCRPLFSCCVHRKDVAGYRGLALVGDQGGFAP